MKRFAFVSLAALGCSGPTTTSPVGSAAPATAALPGPSASAVAARKGCPPGEAPVVPGGAYRHKRTRLFVQSQGSPRHAATDVATRLGQPAMVAGKFTYGKAGKDLEDEEIALHVRDASCEWREVGTAVTDDDGWATIEIPAALLAEPGPVQFDLVVRGDGSRASGFVFPVRTGTRAVVFDVDATLTVGDAAIVQQVLDGAEPEARPSSSELARALAEAGLFPIYLTGRPYMLGPSTRRWLAKHRFPAGLVRTTSSVHEALPSPDGVGAFKSAALAELKAVGIDFALAYGNATTDICAYASAGIDPNKTFILGPHAGAACEGHPPAQALRGYDEHVGRAAELVR